MEPENQSALERGNGKTDAGRIHTQVTMELGKFYTQFLDALNTHEVEYLVVGGQAVNFHGYTRATLDLNVWINKSEKNLQNLQHAFVAMGYENSRSREAVSYFSEHHKINLPKDQNLIEVLDAAILKSDFQDAFKKRIKGTIDETFFFVIDLQTLLEVKSGSNRLQDLNDVEKLKQINFGEDASEPEEGYALE
jgi:hypothetical protein